MTKMEKIESDLRIRVIKQMFDIHKLFIQEAIRATGEEHFSKTEIMILLMIRKQPYKTTDLAKEIGISASTLTGVVDRLEERGYVERIRDEKDRRVVYIKPREPIMEKHRKAKEKLLDRMRKSEGLIEDSWWEDMSEKLEILKSLIEEKDQELRVENEEQ